MQVVMINKKSESGAILSKHFVKHICNGQSVWQYLISQNFPFPPGAADGSSESPALVDDNGSEEDYGYEELCHAHPRYLQPGGEQLAVNEVNF